MKPQTVSILNQINRQFYSHHADQFDQTRHHPWPGWAKLLPFVSSLNQKSLTILDVGCGNARLAAFLATHLHSTAINYTGIDSSPQLLQKASRHSSSCHSFSLISADLLSSDWKKSLPSQHYDVVFCLNVIHHLPFRTHRLRFTNNLSSLVKPHGLLIFSLWQFLNEAHLRRKIISWPQFLSLTHTKLQLSDLEPHDYLLSWGQGNTAFRYCHFVSRSAAIQLIKPTSLTLINTFLADGKNHQLNLYFILQAQS